jgi:tetratricopeptide (TPR) repeat protein
MFYFSRETVKVRINHLSFIKPALPLFFLLMLAGCNSPEQNAQAHLQTGKALLDSGELDKALLEFKAANQDGKHALAYYYMALLDEKQENPATMRENLHSALLLDDGMVDAKLKLAAVEMGFNNLPEAMKQVDGVLIANSDNITALLLKAALYLRQAKYPEALMLIDRVLAREPDNAEAMTAKSEYFFRQNDPELAFTSSELALAKNPDYQPLHQLRIRIYARLHNMDGIITEMQELIRLNPGKDTLKIRLVTALVATDKYQQALEILQNLVNTKPERVDNKLILSQFLHTHFPDQLLPQLELWQTSHAAPNWQLLEIARWMIANQLLEPATAMLNKIADSETDTLIRLTASTRLAEIAFTKKQNAEAEALTDNILQENADLIEASLLKVRLLLAQNKADEAIKLLNGRVWIRDKSGDLNAWLGVAYNQKHEPIPAEKNFKQALELNPANRVAFYPVYNNYLQAGITENAEQMLDKALSSRPYLDWLLLSKVELKIRQKQWDEAKSTLQMLSVLSKDQVTLAYLNANMAQGAGRFEEAIAIYRQILDKIPDHIEAAMNLVRCYEALKARDKAIAFLEAQHAQHPELLPIALMLGDYYTLNKELGKAQKLYSEQIQYTPKAAIVYVTLARLAAFEHKKPDEVAEILLTGLKNNPDNLQLSIALASWYDENGSHELTMQIYQHLAEVYPDSEQVTNNQALLLLNSADPSDIARGVEMARILKDAKSPSHVDTYGWSLLKAGLFDQAITVLKALIEQAPEQIEPHYHLGKAYLFESKKNQAVNEFKRALILADKSKTSFTWQKDARQLVQEFDPGWRQ